MAPRYRHSRRLRFEPARLRFGGWTWRYDLTPAGPSNTTVTLSYDWSAVPGSIREHIGFPPFPPEHLDNSLAHLAKLGYRLTRPPGSAA